MEYVKIAAQVIIALGIYNVWLLRFGKSTHWRGGTATNMKEEFEFYNLPLAAVYVVGFLKLALATALLVGTFFPLLAESAACGLMILMLGAIAMHVKVRDPLKKSLPALSILMLCLFVLA